MKSAEQLYNIFNDKIKNAISYSKFTNVEIKNIKKIINDTLYECKKKYKDNIDYYIYDSSIIIFRKIEKYIEKEIYHDIDFFNKLLRNLFFYYNMFAIIADEDEKEEDKIKWKSKIEDFINNKLNNF